MNRTSSRIALIPAALCVVASGCMVPRPIALTEPLPQRAGAAADTATRTYGQVRLTLRDGSRVELRHVRITADSIHAARQLGRSTVWTAFSRADVARADEMVVSGYNTIVLLGILAGAAMAIASWIDSQVEVPIDLGFAPTARPSAAVAARTGR